MQNFYRKTIYDWVDAMNDSSFVDTAPYVGIQYCGISWESAFLITQYYMYLYYNDLDLVKELYALDKKWMKKAASIHPNGLVEKGLSDHESMEPVPVQLTGTAHYLQCAEIMSLFAQLMGDKEQEQLYVQLADNLREELKAAFWDKTVHDKINRQTLFSTLLYHDIVPENERSAAIDSLLLAISAGPSGHFNTGIFGTKYALETLSASASPERVYDIVNSTEYPGWGHMIDQGATTIWETWKESDNTYSNCHPMFGSVTEWFYRWLGGIRPNIDYPGFERFVISPFVPDNLEFVNTKYKSPFGEIITGWKIGVEDSIAFELKIPEGSSADFRLIANELVNAEIRNMDTNKIFFINAINKNTADVFLENGHYIITGSIK
jgi:alpha-L-rhamnosidase